MLLFTSGSHPVHLYYNEGVKDFNMVADTIDYKSVDVANHMPHHSFYITSLRHPLERLKSAVYSDKKYRDSPHDMVLKYLYKNPILKFKDTGYKYISIPPYMQLEPAEMEKYLKHIMGKIFNFVLISEYFDESLVLLKRSLCWDLEDIIYIPMKTGTNPLLKMQYGRKMIEKHQTMAPGDYALYNFFNKTLWDKINVQEKDFLEEVEFFRKVQGNVKSFCEAVYKNLQPDNIATLIFYSSDYNLTIPRSRWNHKEFYIDSVNCILMKIRKNTFRNIMAMRQFPSLCDIVEFTKSDYPLANWLSFKPREAEFEGYGKIAVSKTFCSERSTRYKIPLKALNVKDALEWT